VDYFTLYNFDLNLFVVVLDFIDNISTTPSQSLISFTSYCRNSCQGAFVNGHGGNERFQCLAIERKPLFDAGNYTELWPLK
jgi:hypothetical protein